MELRARIQPLPRRAAMMAACVALLVTALAAAIAPSAADAKKKRKAPVVTKVAPMDVAVGERLTIRGRNFIRGRQKNTVVFKRDGARAVFAKADVGTKKLLSMKVPATLLEFFRVEGGNAVPTRFRIRILSRTFSKRFTKNKKSPVVSPPRSKQVEAPVADGDCNGDGVKNRDTADDDADLLSDERETQILSDPCKPDTDGDGVEDGYEYRSAIDLNDDEHQQGNTLLAYPHKMPYPNPGFADGGIDYDGDSLTLKEEFDLWVYTYSVTGTDARSLDALSYSDGEQYTRSTRLADGPDRGRRVPTLRADTYDKHAQFLAWAASASANYRLVHLENPFIGVPWWDHSAVRAAYGLLDFNRNGVESGSELLYLDLRPDDYLSDDERDEDADGLSNYDETHGRMLPAYWVGCYPLERSFHIPYQGTSHVNADTDGDTVLDGADDQDHDDVPNVMELSRLWAAAGNLHPDDRKNGMDCNPKQSLPTEDHFPNEYGRVNPFNPCLPRWLSRTCPKVVNKGTGAPFDGSPNWHLLN
jgi:hypothetical protein